MFSSPLDRKSEHVAWGGERPPALFPLHRRQSPRRCLVVLSSSAGFCRVAGEFFCAIINFQILAPNFQRRRSMLRGIHVELMPSNFAAHELSCHACEWLGLNINIGQFMASMPCTKLAVGFSRVSKILKGYVPSNCLFWYTNVPPNTSPAPEIGDRIQEQFRR